MSTRLILGTIGAVVGVYTGIGAYQGFAIGSAIGGALDPPSGPDQTGPRLKDLRAQNSAYGAFIPIVYGSYRLAGNVIWSDDIRETKHEEEVGGKGGGGATSTTFTYSCSFAVSLCEGGDGDESIALRRIFADGKLIYDISNVHDQFEVVENSNFWLRTARRIVNDEEGAFTSHDFAFYSGSETQTPNSTIEAVLGVGNVPAYRGQCYIVFTDMQLAKYGNRIPNLSFEIVKNGVYQNDVDIELFPYTEFTDYALGTVYNPVRDEIWEYRGQGNPAKFVRRNAYTGDILGIIELPAYTTWAEALGNPLYDPANGFIYMNLVNPTQTVYVDASTLEVKGLMYGEDAVTEAANYAVSPVTGHYFRTIEDAGVVRLQARDPITGTDLLDIDITSMFAAPIDGGFHYAPRLVFESTGHLWLFTPVEMYRMTAAGVVVGSYSDPWTVLTIEYDKDRHTMWFTATDPSYYSERTITGITLGVTTTLTHSGTGTGANFVVGQEVMVSDGVTGCTGLWDTINGDAHTVLSVTSTTVTLDFDTSAMPIWTGGGTVRSHTSVLRELDIASMTIARTFDLGVSDWFEYESILYDSGRQIMWLRHNYTDYTNLTAISTFSGRVVHRLNVSGYNGACLGLSVLPDGSLWYNDERFDAGGLTRIAFNDFVDPEVVTLASVVRDISMRCELTDPQITVDELEADIVRGYAVTSSMSGRAAIEPLMSAYVFDSVDSDGTVEFIKRGGTPVAFIPSSDMVATE